MAHRFDDLGPASLRILEEIFEGRIVSSNELVVSSLDVSKPINQALINKGQAMTYKTLLSETRLAIKRKDGVGV